MLEQMNVCYCIAWWLCARSGASVLVFKRQRKPEHRSSMCDSTQAWPCYLWTTCFMLIHVSFACVLLAVFQTN